MPARHVVALTQHLELNPYSRVYAIRGGSPELQGWDQATLIAARTHNLIAALISAFSKGEPSDDLFIDYPGATRELKQPKTLADITVGGFNKFMYG